MNYQFCDPVIIRQGSSAAIAENNPIKRRCDNCSKRRRGCDKGNPCSGCRHLGIECTYSQPFNKTKKTKTPEPTEVRVAKRPKHSLLNQDDDDLTPLHLTAEGHVEVVNFLMGADSEAKDKDERTPLHIAVLNRHVENVKFLVTKLGADANAKDKLGETPTHLAAGAGHVEIMRLLLVELGADANARTNNGRMLLHLAALGGYIEIVRLLVVDFRADVDTKDNDGWRPLHVAVNGGKIEVVRLLVVEFMANANAKVNDGRTPLHLAASEGHTEVVRLLIAEFEANVNAIDDGGWTPLHYAAIQGQVEIIRLLVTEFGADANEETSDKETPLHLAVSGGHTEAVRLLVADLEADVDAIDDDEWTPLHDAAISGHVECLKLLVAEFGADANGKTSNGSTPLHLAAYGGHIEVVKLLVDEFSADVNAENVQGLTPLHDAARNGQVQCMRLFISFGANPKAKNNDGWALLHYVASGGHSEAARLLVVEFGADVNAIDSDGWTPLHYAAIQGQVEILRLLVTEFEADANEETSDKETPLHMAAYGGHIEAVKLLVDEFSADVNAENVRGLTPLHYAARNGQVRCMRLLISFGANPKAKDNDGRTLLHYAASEGYSEAVRLLVVEFGADVNATDSDGRTPLHQTADKEHVECMRLLITEFGANPKAKDNDGWTLLHWAASRSHVLAPLSALAQNTPSTSVFRPQGSAISLPLTSCDRCKDRNLQCDQIHPTCGACAISDPHECSYPPMQQTPVGPPVADLQREKPSVNGRPPAAAFHKENWALVKKLKHSFTFVPGNAVKRIPKDQSKKDESSAGKQKKTRRDELKRTAEVEVEQTDKSPRMSSAPIAYNPFTDQQWALGENPTPITPFPSVSDSESLFPASPHDRQMSPVSNRANLASPKPVRKSSTSSSKAATDDQAMVTDEVSTWNNFQPLVPEGEDTVPVIHKTKFRGRPPRSRWQPHNEGKQKKKVLEISESFDISHPLSPTFPTNLSSITLRDHALSRGDNNALWTLSYTHNSISMNLNTAIATDFFTLLSSLVTSIGTYNPNINPNTIPSWVDFGPQSATETSNSYGGTSNSSNNHNNNNAMQLINKDFLGKYGSRTYKEELYESGIFETKWTWAAIAQEMSLTLDHTLQQLAGKIIGQFLSCGNVLRPTIHGKRFAKWFEELVSPMEDALVMAIMAAWCRHTLLIHPTSTQNFTIDQVKRLESRFRHRALELFEDMFDQPSYETLCTLCILVGSPERHEIFHQLAGRIIHTLDLFSRVSPRSADAPPLDPQQQFQEEMERRVWWDWYYNNDCCKVLPTLSLAEFEKLILPSPLPEESEEDAAGVIFHFGAKATLMVVQRAASDVIDAHGQAMSRNKLAQFEKMLADWLESRPAFFKLDDPARVYTNVWTFYLAVEVNIKYHYSRLIFHRLFVKENANSDSVAICVRSCEDIIKLLHAQHAANYCRPNVHAWIDVCDTLLDLMNLGVLNKEHERSVRHSLAKALHLLEKTKAYEKKLFIFIQYGEELEEKMAKYGISALASLEGEDYFEPDLSLCRI